MFRVCPNKDFLRLVRLQQRSNFVISSTHMSAANKLHAQIVLYLNFRRKITHFRLQLYTKICVCHQFSLRIYSLETAISLRPMAFGNNAYALSNTV